MALSIFHFKGNAYMGLGEFIRDYVPGGVPAVLERIPDEATRTFLQQPFIASVWYDILPLVPITLAAAQAKGTTHGVFMRELADFQATRDANGIYRLLLKVISPEMLVLALPRTARRYFDFVTTEVTRKSGHEFELDVSGIPEPLAEIYSPVTENFITHALTLAGAKSPRVTTSAPIRTGVSFGMPIVRFDRKIVWS